MLLGFGVSLLAVFPKVAVSQTTPYEEPVFLQGNPQTAEILYEAWKSKPFCSCVTYVRQFRDFPPIGMAKNLPITSKTPSVGAIMVTSESYAGHVALVIGVTDTTVTIKEANFVPCQKDERTLNINDKRIKGYYE